MMALAALGAFIVGMIVGASFMCAAAFLERYRAAGAAFLERRYRKKAEIVELETVDRENRIKKAQEEDRDLLIEELFE